MTEHPPEPILLPEIYFAASTGAFYDKSLWAAELPDDAVLVEGEDHTAQLAAEASGLLRGVNEAGHPVAIEPAPPTIEDLAAQARRRRDQEIIAIQWLIERHRGEVTLGRTTTLTNEDYLLVLQHAQDLRDVPEQEAFPTDIEWPVLPPELLATGA